MTRWSKTPYTDDASALSGSVTALASRALSEVVSQRQAHTYTDYPSLIAAMGDAVLADDPEARMGIVADLLKRGVTSDDIVFNHAPDTARLLGERWGRSEISFADVTIGTARLQETVRLLSNRKPTEITSTHAPRVLLIVPTEEDHVFGGLMAALSFEQLGCDVTFAVGHDRNELLEIFRKGRFDMVGLSISSRRNIRHVRALIETLRSAARVVTPFVLGGSLTAADDLDLKQSTRADVITSSPEAALKSCGIALESFGSTVGKDFE